MTGSSSNNHQQNRRGRGGRGRNPRTVAGREVPKEDFDFETANDGLDKTLLEEEFQSKLKIGRPLYLVQVKMGHDLCWDCKDTSKDRYQWQW